MPDLTIQCSGFTCLPQARQSITVSLVKEIAGIKGMKIEEEQVTCSFNFATYQVNSEKKTIAIIVYIFDRPKEVKELLVKKVKDILQGAFPYAKIVCRISILDNIYATTDGLFNNNCPVKKYPKKINFSDIKMDMDK